MAAFEVPLAETVPVMSGSRWRALKDAKAHINLHVAADGAAAMAFLRYTEEYSDVPRPDLVLLGLNLTKRFHCHD